MGTRRNRAYRNGFTLIETAIAVCIVGTGLVSLMASSRSSSQVNDAGTKLTQAVSLAQEIREWTLSLPLTDDAEASVADMADQTFDPPANGRGMSMGEMTGWSQHVQLTWLAPDALTPVADGASDTAEVEVTISFNDEQVFTTSWLAVEK